MSQNFTSSIEGLGEVIKTSLGNSEVTVAPIVYEKKVDAQGRAYATGRRKSSSACVWIKPGNGTIEVNGRAAHIYFLRQTQQMLLKQPLVAADRLSRYDVRVRVRGGGLSGQAGALRHGLARALTCYEPALRPLLKSAGFLTRDSRVVERKKFGRRKARRSFQFSKR